MAKALREWGRKVLPTLGLKQERGGAGWRYGWAAIPGRHCHGLGQIPPGHLCGSWYKLWGGSEMRSVYEFSSSD